MRRLIAAVSLAALGLTLTVPLATAHDQQWVHEFAWTTSPDPSTAPDGSVVWSNDELVAAKITMNDGVKSWDVVIRPVNGGQASTCHEDLATDRNGNYPPTVYINCPWDTTRAKNHILPGPTPGSVASKPRPTTPDEPRRTWQSQDLGPSVNGKYTIEIIAYNAGRGAGLVSPAIPSEAHHLYQSGSNPPRWREVWVVNGIAQPAGVSSAYDPATGKVAVTWAPNPEPDVSYIVQEKVGDGKWSSGVTVPGNANRFERAADAGTYQFRVAAQRPAPTRDDGGATKRSEFVASQAVEVVPPPPPTAAGANNADGVPAGGEPGVFIPETPSSTSPPGSPGSGSRKPPRSTARPAGGSRPSGGFSRPTGSTAPVDAEAEGMGPDEGFSSVLPYNEQRDGFIDDLGDDEEEEVSMLPGVPVPRPRDTRALLVPMAAGLALFVLAMHGIVFFRGRPALAGGADDFDDFDDWLRY